MYQSGGLKRGDNLGRPTCRWVDNIKMDLKRKRMWSCVLHSSGSGQISVSDSCEHDYEFSGVTKGEEFFWPAD